MAEKSPQKAKRTKEWLEGYDAGCRIQYNDDVFKIEQMKQQTALAEKKDFARFLNKWYYGAGQGIDILDRLRELEAEIKKLEGTKHEQDMIRTARETAGAIKTEIEKIHNSKEHYDCACLENGCFDGIWKKFGIKKEQIKKLEEKHD